MTGLVVSISVRMPELGSEARPNDLAQPLFLTRGFTI
jgi:hypothetical protein